MYSFTSNNLKTAAQEVPLTCIVLVKFVSDLLQVGGFLRVLRFPPSIKLTAMI
jgi:hypothetical protein